MLQSAGVLRAAEKGRKILRHIQFFLKCRFTIDVLQKVKKEVTNSESCVTVKLLHQKSNKEAIRQ